MGSLCDSNACAGCGMRTLFKLMARGDRPGVRILLALKGFVAPLAVLVEVINNPSGVAELFKNIAKICVWCLNVGEVESFA